MNNVRKKDENRIMTQDMLSCSSVLIALSSSADLQVAATALMQIMRILRFIAICDC